jgi:hypothetical protein
LALENEQLVAQREQLCLEVATTANDVTKSREDGGQNSDHRSTLAQRRTEGNGL